jgi:hypothetical protein
MTRNPPGAIGAAEGGRVLSSKARLEFGESEQATSYVTATQIISVVGPSFAIFQVKFINDSNRRLGRRGEEMWMKEGSLDPSMLSSNYQMLKEAEFEGTPHLPRPSGRPVPRRGPCGDTA